MFSKGVSKQACFDPVPTYFRHVVGCLIKNSNYRVPLLREQRPGPHWIFHGGNLHTALINILLVRIDWARAELSRSGGLRCVAWRYESGPGGPRNGASEAWEFRSLATLGSVMTRVSLGCTPGVSDDGILAGVVDLTLRPFLDFLSESVTLKCVGLWISQ